MCWRAHGVGAATGSRSCCRRAPEVAAAHIAIYKLGAIALPLAMLFGAEALGYRLQNSGARALITNAQGLAKLAEASRQARPSSRWCSRSTARPTARSASTTTARARVVRLHAATTPRADDPALMIYTSGTTGPPKGALHAHRVLLGHLPGVEMPHDFLPQPGDRFWTPADWAWAGGLLDVLLPALHHGVPVVAAPVRQVRSRGGLRADGAARRAQRLHSADRAAHDARGRRPARALRSQAAHASAPAARRSAPRRWNGAATRSASPSTSSTARPNAISCSAPARRSACRGRARSARPVPGHSVAVIDADGRGLPPRRDRPDRRAAARSGDVPRILGQAGGDAREVHRRLDDHRRPGRRATTTATSQFVGRDDDVITSSGYRIGPAEIEDCLIRHPAVALAAAVGKPDPVRTEIVKAFVVLKAGYRAVRRARRRDPGASSRRGCRRTNIRARSRSSTQMPMTTTGKVIRRLLRQQA